MSSAHMQPPPHTMSSQSPRFGTIFLVILATHSPSKIQSVFLLPMANFQYQLPVLTDYLSWSVPHTKMLILASAVFVSSSCLEPAWYLVNSLLSIAAACSNDQTSKRLSQWRETMGRSSSLFRMGYNQCRWNLWEVPLLNLSFYWACTNRQCI